MILGLFIGANVGFLLGCAFAGSVLRRRLFEEARERGRWS